MGHSRPGAARQGAAGTRRARGARRGGEAGAHLQDIRQPVGAAPRHPTERRLHLGSRVLRGPGGVREGVAAVGEQPREGLEAHGAELLLGGAPPAPLLAEQGRDRAARHERGVVRGEVRDEQGDGHVLGGDVEWRSPAQGLGGLPSEDSGVDQLQTQGPFEAAPARRPPQRCLLGRLHRVGAGHAAVLYSLPLAACDGAGALARVEGGESATQDDEDDAQAVLRGGGLNARAVGRTVKADGT